MSDEIKYNDYKSAYSFKQRAAPGYKKSSVKYSRREKSEYNPADDNIKFPKSDKEKKFLLGKNSTQYDSNGNKKDYNDDNYSRVHYSQNEVKNGDITGKSFFSGNKFRQNSNNTEANSWDNNWGSSGTASSGIDSIKDINNQNSENTFISFKSDIKYGDMEYISAKTDILSNQTDVLQTDYDSDYMHLFEDIENKPGGDVKYFAAKKSVEYAKKVGKIIKENTNDSKLDNGYGYDVTVDKTTKGITKVIESTVTGIITFASSALGPLVIPMIIGIIIVVSIGAISISLLNKKPGYAVGGFSSEVEKWRGTVKGRCDYYKDSYNSFDTTQFVNAILATIDQESNGISSICGGDLMQSRESGYWSSGIPSDWDKFTTEQKSIDAGCRYFFSALEAWGCTDPGDYGGLQVVAQGYNMGTAYIGWMKDINETKWTNATAEAYSAKMKSQLGVSVFGNPIYGEQWLEKYKKGIATSNSTYSGDFVALDGTYIFQQGSGPCTDCGIADMMYRYLYLSGDTNWDSFNPEMTTDDGITLYDLIISPGGKATASWGRFDLSGTVHCETHTGWLAKDGFTTTIHGINITVSDSNWTGFSSDEDARQFLLQHPEGVAVYNGLHCIVLTRYDETEGVFYCVDPGQWGSSSVGFPAENADGRKEIPLYESGSHAVKSIAEIKGYWYIESGGIASPGDSTGK